MFELYFPKSPRDWASILCFLLDQKVSSLLLFVFSLELSQRVREIRKTWTNTNLEVTNILTLTTVAMILTSHASVRSVLSVLVSGDMMWDWDLVIGLWLLTAATAHISCVAGPGSLQIPDVQAAKKHTMAMCVSPENATHTQPWPWWGHVSSHLSRHVTHHTRGSSGLQGNSGKLSWENI